MRSSFQIFVFCFICLTAILLGMFIGSIINLYNFNKCNSIDFNSNYCIKYKNY